MPTFVSAKYCMLDVMLGVAGAFMSLLNCGARLRVGLESSA